MSKQLRYLVFDIETAVDGELVAKLRYPGEKLSPQEAVAKYQAEMLEERGTEFLPFTFHMPVAVVVGKVSSDFRLIDLVALDEPEFRPHVLARDFWRGWEGYRRPTLVTFNGRTFDLPVLELAALRYGLSVGGWFDVSSKSFEQARNRFNVTSHIDLQELLTNFGATRFPGGLTLAANLLGKPGKMETEGSMVQSMYDQGRLAEINDYCRCDVLDTYFVFLRSRVMLGQLGIDEEQGIVAETKEWLSRQAPHSKGLQLYLDRWGDWPNPWKPTP
jgi:predicted PolB exonuclease-like 3'-5' exonuclease